MTEPSYTPTAARDLHRNLIEWWGSRQAQNLANTRADYAADVHDGDRRDWYTEINPTAERNRLRAAETFLVTDDMSAVCRHAAMSLPTLAIDHSTLPAEVGFVVFNDRLTDHTPELKSTVPIEMACWYPAVFNDQAGVAISTYVSPGTVGLIAARSGDRNAAKMQAFVTDQFRAPAIPAMWTFLPWGQEPPADALPYVEDEYAARMLVAVWLLMGQPIAQHDRPPVQRAAAKRALRAGLTTDLTVITLRQPRHPDGDEPASREYHRRWIVRGHWRRIPTPEAPQRVTWVHGYVKGPADAPLVVTDRVTVLAR